MPPNAVILLLAVFLWLNATRPAPSCLVASTDRIQGICGVHAPAAEMVLLRLRASFFGDFAGNAPEREEIKRSIAAALVTYVPIRDTPSEAGEEGELSVEYIYGKLRDAGWLREENDRWRTFVDMPPGCQRLLAVLAILKEESARSFTGLVSEVSTLINAIIADPQNHATNIDGACRVANSFRQIMTEIDAGLGEFSKTLDDAESLDEAILLFFSDFLSTRVADWASVMARNNPWRSRNNIAIACAEFKA